MEGLGGGTSAQMENRVVLPKATLVRYSGDGDLDDFERG